MHRRRYGKKADLALNMWVKLARAFATFNKRAWDDIRSYGLTQPQFGVIEMLGHLGPLSLGELSRKQLSSCGNTTVVVDNLEREGLVERIPSKDDRRRTYVQLSRKGQSLFDRVFEKHATFVESLASVLTSDEQKELARLLKKLGRAIAEE